MFSKENRSSKTSERKMRVQAQSDLFELVKEHQFLETSVNEHAIVSWTDSKGVITQVNTLFEKISGYSKDELIGATHSIVNSGFHSKEFFDDLWRTISSGSTWSGVICNKRKNGSLYWVTSTIVPYLNKQMEISGYLGIRTDITDKIHLYSELNQIKEINQYTGLPNIGKYADQHSAALRKHSCAIICIEIINKNKLSILLGEEKTRELVQKFCDIINSAEEHLSFASHQDDTIFTVVPQTSLLYAKYHTYQSIAEFKESIGLLEFRLKSLPCEDFSELQSHLELSKAFRGITDQKEFFEINPVVKQTLRRSFELEMALAKAFENKEFYFDIQPIIDPKLNSVAGGELLMRWNSPRFGKVMPTEFISLLANNPLLDKLTYSAFNKAISIVRGRPKDSFYISLNITADLLGSASFINNVLAQAGENIDLLSRIRLEIVESYKMHNSSEIQQNISAFRAMGGQIMMDDFGAGYASLETFNNFEFDYIKIDKSFVDDSEVDEKKAKMLEVIFDISGKFDVHCVFEGVENIEQVNIIKELKNSLIQGYYFHQPLPEQEFRNLLN